jgi:hypothetical protein
MKYEMYFMWGKEKAQLGRQKLSFPTMFAEISP